MPGKLTQKERELVAELERRESQDPDVGASYDELKTAIGLRSKSGVFRMIESLVRKQWVEREPNRARTLRLIHRLGGPPRSGAGPGPESAQTTNEALLRELERRGFSPSNRQSLAGASDEQILEEVERRGLRAAVVAAYEFDAASKRIGK